MPNRYKLADKKNSQINPKDMLYYSMLCSCS